MHQIKWTERKFPFGFEKGYVPFFIERLNSTLPRLEELLKGCSETEASVKPGNGWSVKEHTGHLSDLESLHDGRIDDLIAGLAVLRPADMSNKDTDKVGHNERSIPELLSLFRNTRNKFIRRIESLDERYFEIRALHPRLQQTVTLTDLLFFIAEHDNHHLTRIAQLLQKDK